MAAFHEKCDEVRNTLTLIRTEHGKTIGGFTFHGWTSSDEWYYVPKNSKISAEFIFSLDRMEKFSPSNRDYSIINAKNRGPYFGNGDIEIYD